MAKQHDHPHGHEHKHPQSHEHDHPHEHTHPQSHEQEHLHSHSSRPPAEMRASALPPAEGRGSVCQAGASGGHGSLERPATCLATGAGAGKVVFFDAPSGLAGDMIIAALLDLGVPLSVIERAVATLPIEGFHLHRGHAQRSGIVATLFDVHLESAQPERSYSAIDAMLAGSSLDAATCALARRIFRRLGEAEAQVHRIPLDEVHFHEVGAVDAIVDIVGAAAAITYLGATIIASPLPMGRGFVKARHGVLPLPAPAAVECLRGVPTYGVDVEAELVTPTGAAIVSTVAERFERWPALVPDRVGYGAGHRDLVDRPNLLRVVLGEQTTGTEEVPSAASHVLVEANVDDLTGEVAAHAIEALFAAGAADAWASPITMKKGRPALTLSALAPAAHAEAVAAAMLAETTTIGVRKSPVSRTERPRRTITVATAFGPIAVKVSEGPFGPPQIKPEFDDCAAAARAHGVPVRVVIQAAMVAASA